MCVKKVCDLMMTCVGRVISSVWWFSLPCAIACEVLSGVTLNLICFGGGGVGECLFGVFSYPLLFVIFPSVFGGLVGAVSIDVVLGFDFVFRRPLVM